MFQMLGKPQSFCDGVSRRDFLRLGAAGLGGLAFPKLLRARQNSQRAVIIVCLPGGPSHLDMYDMKPAAPEKIRGEFKPIRTKVPGFDMCELMPKQAALADKLAVVRNMRFQQGDHQLHEVFTGFPGRPGAGFMSAPAKPAFGSIVARLKKDEKALLPRYMCLSLSDHPRTVAPAQDPLFLGAAYRPFEPSGAGLDSMTLRDGMTLEAFDDRRKLLENFDTIRRDIDSSGELSALDELHEKAFAMITSEKVRDAFDVSLEPASVRKLYGPDVKFKHQYQFGHTWFASKFLQARRLVEAGVPVVTLGVGGWDHHGMVRPTAPKGSLFDRMREQLPIYDHSIHALVTDLHQRGLDKDVAVVVWGEFGRTPVVNKVGGRDHWPRAGFSLFFGGGFRTGQVIGRTDKDGYQPDGKIYTPQHVFATLYRHLGIDPDLTTYTDPSGRPVHLLDKTEAISEL